MASSKTPEVSSTTWQDRKHVLWFPFSFIKYELRNERLHTQKGFFKTTFDEVLLYRITDIQLTRTFGQKLCGTGTIVLCTKIDHDAHIVLQNIKKPKAVKDMLSNEIEKARIRYDVISNEFIEINAGRNGDPARHDHKSIASKKAQAHRNANLPKD